MVGCVAATMPASVLLEFLSGMARVTSPVFGTCGCRIRGRSPGLGRWALPLTRIPGGSMELQCVAHFVRSTNVRRCRCVVDHR